jgi:hypothetical protein
MAHWRKGPFDPVVINEWLTEAKEILNRPSCPLSLQGADSIADRNRGEIFEAPPDSAPENGVEKKKHFAHCKPNGLRFD